MQTRHIVRMLVLTTTLIATGCGETKVDSPAAPAQSATTSQATPTKPSASNATASAKDAQAEITGTDISGPKTTNAEITGAELAPPAEPTTAAAALAMIDLEKLPKLTVKKEFEAQPMSINYTGAGSLKNADDFIKNELTKLGWKETKNLASSNDQYVDRLFTKDGYYLRAILSPFAADEISVSLSALGNFDVRSLPKTKDAEPQESTAVMSTHLSSLSISAAAEELSRRMNEAGWQEVQDFQAPPADVPSFRSIHFRKQAVRVHLGLAQDPSNSKSNTNIFYHAESVLPIDLPTIDASQPMKYDAVGNRASIPYKGDRTKLVELLKQQAPSFGWQLMNTDEYVEEKISTLYIGVGSPIGIAARYVESAGNYYLSMERVKLPAKYLTKSE